MLRVLCILCFCVAASSAENCVEDPCQNGAICTTVNESSVDCSCTPGYTDHHCDTKTSALWTPLSSENCVTACQDVGSSPVVGGHTLPGNVPFYVCAGYFLGYRSGHNKLGETQCQPPGTWVNQFSCLCEGGMEWRPASGGIRCMEACEKPVFAGFYKNYHPKDPYFVCRATSDSGYTAPGLQQDSWSENCTVTGIPADEDEKDCLCHTDLTTEVPTTPDCKAIVNSIPSPTTCSCFALYNNPKSWADAYMSCHAIAPPGFKGRLAFADDQTTFDILQSLSTDRTWVGLKSTVSDHQVSPMNISEWAWHEGDVAIKPLSFIPSVGEILNRENEQCLNYEFNGLYSDIPCDFTVQYYCEFVENSCIVASTSMSTSSPTSVTPLKTTEVTTITSVVGPVMPIDGICPRGYQMLSTVDPPVIHVMQTCTYYEPADCVDQCYWANQGDTGPYTLGIQGQGDCGPFGTSDQYNIGVGTLWQEGTRAVYIAGINMSATIDQKYCCVSKKHIVTVGSCVGGSSADGKYLYRFSGSGDIPAGTLDISTLGKDKPIVREFESVRLPAPDYDYKISICGTEVNPNSICNGSTTAETTSKTPTVSTVTEKQSTEMHFTTAMNEKTTEHSTGFKITTTTSSGAPVVTATNNQLKTNPSTTIIYEKATTAHSTALKITATESINDSCATLGPTQPKDCAAIKTTDGGAPSGRYTIKPFDDCTSLQYTPVDFTRRCCVDVWCDMDTTGGGWTVFQKRFNGSQNFQLQWKDYQNGFGSPDAEHWLGLEYLKTLTTVPTMMMILVREHEHPACDLYSTYSGFQIVGDEYSLTYTNNVGQNFGEQDALGYHNTRMFSTIDVDNDANTHDCAGSYKGGWWYGSCHRVNLNGLYSPGCKGSQHMTVHAARGNFYSFETSVMMIRPSLYADVTEQNSFCIPDPNRYMEKCPGDCEWTSWSTWSECSNICGTGTQERNRAKNTTISYAMDCFGDSEQQQNCTGTSCVDGPGWIDANMITCTQACNTTGHEAVKTGMPNPALGDYHVCAVDYADEGLIPGFQIDNFYGSNCFFTSNGTRVQAQNKTCLCDEALVWVDANAIECGVACTAAGHVRAMETGKPHLTEGDYYICAAEYNGQGLRPGFQIDGSNRCFMSYGSYEVSRAYKKCLCVGNWQCANFQLGLSPQGNVYFHNHWTANWDSQDSQCQSAGGHLPIITDSSELSFLKEVIYQTKRLQSWNIQQVWLAAKVINHQVLWTPNNALVTWAPWAPGEPLFSEDIDECLVYLVASDTWEVQPCFQSTTTYAICQMSGMNTPQQRNPSPNEFCYQHLHRNTWIKYLPYYCGTIGGQLPIFKMKSEWDYFNNEIIPLLNPVNPMDGYIGLGGKIHKNNTLLKWNDGTDIAWNAPWSNEEPAIDKSACIVGDAATTQWKTFHCSWYSVKTICQIKAESPWTQWQPPTAEVATETTPTAIPDNKGFQINFCFNPFLPSCNNSLSSPSCNSKCANITEYTNSAWCMKQCKLDSSNHSACYDDEHCAEVCPTEDIICHCSQIGGVYASYSYHHCFVMSPPRFLYSWDDGEKQCQTMATGTGLRGRLANFGVQTFWETAFATNSKDMVANETWIGLRNYHDMSSINEKDYLWQTEADADMTCPARRYYYYSMNLFTPDDIIGFSSSLNVSQGCVFSIGGNWTSDENCTTTRNILCELTTQPRPQCGLAGDTSVIIDEICFEYHNVKKNLSDAYDFCLRKNSTLYANLDNGCYRKELHRRMSFMDYSVWTNIKQVSNRHLVLYRDENQCIKDKHTINADMGNPDPDRRVYYFMKNGTLLSNSNVTELQSVICTRTYETIGSTKCENSGVEAFGRCHCFYETYGDKCEKIGCSSYPCQHNGTCVYSQCQYECNCTSEYEGTHCEYQKACLSNPCMNYANCTHDLGNYTCHCKEGYYGTNCEYEDLCTIQSPCMHDGTCIAIGNAFNCTCTQGYSGKTCNETITTLQVTAPMSKATTETIRQTTTTTTTTSTSSTTTATTTATTTSVITSIATTTTTSLAAQHFTTIAGSSTVQIKPETTIFGTDTTIIERAMTTDFTTTSSPEVTSMETTKFLESSSQSTSHPAPTTTTTTTTAELATSSQAPISTTYLQHIMTSKITTDRTSGSSLISDEKPSTEKTTTSSVHSTRFTSATTAKRLQTSENKPKINQDINKSGEKTTTSYTERETETETPTVTSMEPFKFVQTSEITTSSEMATTTSIHPTTTGRVTEAKTTPLHTTTTTPTPTATTTITTKTSKPTTSTTKQVVEPSTTSTMIGGTTHPTSSPETPTVKKTTSIPYVKSTSSTVGPTTQLITTDKLSWSTKYKTAAKYTSVPEDKCLSNPCTHGNCSNVKEGYRCSCIAGYSGMNCELEVDECQSSPCLNGAPCADLLAGYSCACINGYTGAHCETDANECDSVPCMNDGTCTNKIGLYYCECPEGYNGSNCEDDIDECTLNECQNNATCKDGINNFTCDCLPGFTGKLCDINFDECKPNPCKNGGTCEDAINGYKCKCHANYHGINCELVYQCHSQPCLNGATCNEENKGYSCSCTAGYKGKNCDKKNECASSPCKHGTCAEMNSQYKCNCKKGYTGKQCDISSLNVNINHCSSEPCMNGGTCNNYNYYYKCACTDGFKGTKCETDANECLSQPCQNNATCVDGVGNFTCFCANGYSGIHCEENINECESDPCTNNGNCIDDIGGYVCGCQAGFMGTHCEQEINECGSNPCMNNGKCTDRIGHYTCICPHGYSGKNCEKEIKECLSNPCQNNGECTDGIGWYTCTCFLGYNGTHCEQEILECESNPCQNNGRCTDEIGSYTCACPRGYSGTHCEKEIKECLSNPCLNNGECTDGIGGYICKCILGYNGTHCEKEIMECESNPCQNNGRCTDHIGSYICTCPRGYHGTHCEKEIKECLSSPCLNNGECSDGIGGYTCTCLVGYSGIICEEDVNECASSPCVQGTCEDLVSKYNCICPNGTVGEQCNEDFDECSSNPCGSHGTCHNLKNHYNCSCEQGFLGDMCEKEENECDSNPCLNNGTCADLVGAYECTCPAAYTGVVCDKDFNECTSNPCGSGTCVNLVGKYRCKCVMTTGPRCETSIPKGTRMMKLGSKAQGNKWPFNPRDFPELDEESPFDDGEVTAAVLPNGTVVLVPLDPDQPEPEELTVLCKQEPNPDGSCHAKWLSRAGTCLILQNMTSTDKTCFEGKPVEANDPVMRDPAVMSEISKSEPISKPSVPIKDIDPNDCWGPCSASCGIGRRQNLRSKDHCSKLDDTQLCRDRECPLDCKYIWNEWGVCSSACGGGVRWRTPLLKQKPRHGGTKCPDPQRLCCNVEECPTDLTERTPSTASTATPTSTSTELRSTTPVFPLSEVEETVVDVIQSLGCSFILGSLAFTLAVFLVIRDFSHERCLQMNMEIALLLAHVLVLTLRDKTEWPLPCKLASIALQFFFVASFAFMALEGLQAYAMCTNVISFGGYFTRLEAFIIGWGGSAIVTGITAAFQHDNYVSHWSCWTNLGNAVSMATVIPIGCLAAATIVLAEAAGMGNRSALPGTNKDQLTAAIANTKGLMVILPVSVASWFCGLFAVYYANLAMFSLVSALNIALGVTIFSFHSLGNPKVHGMIKQFFSKLCGN